MPHGDAVGMSSAFFFLFGRELGHVDDDDDDDEEAGHERRMMYEYVPGGVMSVATASALKVKWPDVCRKASVSDWVLMPLVFM